MVSWKADCSVSRIAGRTVMEWGGTWMRRIYPAWRAWTLFKEEQTEVPYHTYNPFDSINYICWKLHQLQVLEEGHPKGKGWSEDTQCNHYLQGDDCQWHRSILSSPKTTCLSMLSIRHWKGICSSVYQQFCLSWSVICLNIWSLILLQDCWQPLCLDQPCLWPYKLQQFADSIHLKRRDKQCWRYWGGLVRISVIKQMEKVDINIPI